MKSLLAFVVLTSLVVLAQSSAKPAAGPTAQPEQEIVEILQQWLTAAHAGNAAELDSIEADEFIATTPAGDVVSKKELMPEPGSNTLPKLSARGNTIRIHGDTAVLMTRLVGEAGGLQYNLTNVFVRRDGKWRMIAAQLSPQPRN